MDKINVMLSSAGRRSYLVRYFVSALHGRGEVFTCNAIPDTAAMVEANKSYIVPFAYEEDYLETILEICKKEKVNILFSLHDIEGPILAKNKQVFIDNGILPVISDLDVINMCLDKVQTYNFLEKHNIQSARTYLHINDFLESSDSATFPVFIKPRWGFGSIDNFLANDKEELVFLYEFVERRKNTAILSYLGHPPDEPATIIQEKLTGQEYGLGIVNDFDAKFQGSLMMKKIGMRYGETDGAEIIVDKELDQLSEKLSKLVGHVGLMDCDLFYDGEKYSILELNPRFGGQYPFAHEAGTNLPEYYLGLFANEKVELRLPQTGKRFLKDIIMLPFND